MHPATIVTVRMFPYLEWMTLVYLALLLLAMPACGQAIEDTRFPPQSNKHREAHPLESTAKQQSRLLYTVLVAEMAANRGLMEATLTHYLQAARLTPNPIIAQQATQWAIEFQSGTAAMTAAELWAKRAPGDLQSQMICATLLIGQSIQKATPYLTRALEINPIAVNQHIGNIQSRLSEKSALHLKIALHQIAKAHPSAPYIHTAAAQTAANVGDFTNATMWVNSAIALKSDLTSALILKAQLMRNEDDTDTRALAFLAAQVTRFREDAELGLFYATALLDAHRIPEAITHLQLLSTHPVHGGQALIYLGEAYATQEKFQPAIKAFKQALAYSDDRDQARYLLGELAEHQGQVSEAIHWYSNIQEGLYQIPAVLRTALLLKDNQAYEAAIQVLQSAHPTTLEEQKSLFLLEIDILAAHNQLANASQLAEEVLTQLPDDPDILLAHATIAAQLKQWSSAEHDLQQILNTNPNNANALNALGWLHYHVGNSAAALSYLTKASEYSTNADIVAHLGEVLWVTGKQQEARTLLTQALKKNPGHETLLETVRRLNIDI